MKRILLASLLMTSSAIAADVSVKTFPNGLTWIHRPVRHNRIAAVRLAFPWGTAVEPPEKAGVTQLMTSLLFKGTQDKNALAYAQAVESLGGAIDAGADDDAWSLSGQVTTDRFDAFFGLFREALLRPSFPAEEVAKEREAQLNAIRAAEEQIHHVASERLAKALYPGHPYGRPEEGELSTVAALSREDVAARHRAAADPRGAVLVTVGDLPMKPLEAAVASLAAAWNAPGPAAAAPGPLKYPDGAVTAEESRPFEQSYLMMAWPAPAFGAEGFAAVKVLNAWLGAGMSSPLFMKVREEKGLAYEVASYFPSRRLGSAFTVYAGMDPTNLDSAGARARGVVEGALEAPPTAAELEAAKRYIRGHFAMDHQTNGRIAWYLAFYQLMGKGWGYDAVYPEDIQRVTANDVHRAAKKIFGRPPVVVRVRSAGKKR